MKKGFLLLTLTSLVLSGCSFGPKNTSSQQSYSSSQSSSISPEVVESSVLERSVRLGKNVQELPKMKEIFKVRNAKIQHRNPGENYTDIEDVTEPSDEITNNPAFFRKYDGEWERIDNVITEIKQEVSRVIERMTMFDTWVIFDQNDTNSYYLSYDFDNDALILRGAYNSNFVYQFPDGREFSQKRYVYIRSTYNDKGEKVIDFTNTYFAHLVATDETIPMNSLSVCYVENEYWDAYQTYLGFYGDKVETQREIVHADISGKQKTMTQFDYREGKGMPMIENFGGDLLSVLSLQNMYQCDCFDNSGYFYLGGTMNGVIPLDMSISLYELKGYKKIEHHHNDPTDLGDIHLFTNKGDEFVSFDWQKFEDLNWSPMMIPVGIDFIPVLGITSEKEYTTKELKETLLRLFSSIGLLIKNDYLDEALETYLGMKDIMKERELYGKQDLSQMTDAEFEVLWATNRAYEPTLEDFEDYLTSEKVAVDDQDTKDIPLGYSDITGSGTFTVDEENAVISVTDASFRVHSNALLDKDTIHRGVVALKSDHETKILATSEDCYYDGVNDINIIIEDFNFDLSIMDFNLEDYQIVMYLQRINEYSNIRVSKIVPLEYEGEDIDLEVRYVETLEPIDDNYPDFGNQIIRTTYKCLISNSNGHSALSFYQTLSVVEPEDNNGEDDNEHEGEENVPSDEEN